MIKIEILSVRNPRWASEDRRHISCFVRTNTIIDEVPFTASVDDVETHGRELYERLRSGQCGAIAPMEPQVISEAPAHFNAPPEHAILQSFLTAANKENDLKSSRGIIAVWGSVLEEILDSVVDEEVARARAVGEIVGRPSKGFSAAINFARERSFVDELDVEKFHSIRRIRNVVAHKAQLSLQNTDVLVGLRALYDADHSRYFRYHEDLDFLVQMIYAGSASKLALKLARVLAQMPGVDSQARRTD